MDTFGDWTYRFFRNGTNRLLVSVAIAYVLSLCSLVSFSLTGGNASRIQFVLLAGAAGVLFYSLIRAAE